ncbi:NAD-dependent glycerol dehydrogenase [Fulvia fulva]|uniref:NAD-dependent glycerol dehydrogenase n=1 Tax=Passalora fulva TaxID=5499 RepID=A0A9Q8P9P7_PASFU|nr:NAD-dependent glycerol dehydrogenase [Fulvia fulva]KAK4623909.1 NAD-dependent glycerol dehydrogenase [Fulvia fulva]KAK4625422.1 NAD-dependent glycerol dehydrogenase [Fulvia fulva]UJO18166.1 NAD-dependent glycerol dehydrogenase [Fulvia fulva]WPV15392.1 NAD-dependent glycerol dehydrogenase [Fulvia fulva]WPV29585.1 NAD-dependent glycerol dehydrogenase [Fulvia fulva]
MALASRLAILVGGIGGLGSVTGKLLHSQGAKLALLYAPFEKQKVTPTLQEIYNQDGPSPDISTYECDITSADSVTAAFASISKDNHAFPSILVNTAGYVNLQPLESFPVDDILRHYMVNLHGPTLTGQAFAKLYFAASKIASDANRPVPGGRIVNIASQAAHIALRHHGPYCASKAGLIGLTKCMASEWGPRGITANSISPGPVMTELGKKAWGDPQVAADYLAAVPTGQFAEPEEVARIVDFLVKDEARNTNGADVRLDGGFTVR